MSDTLNTVGKCWYLEWDGTDSTRDWLWAAETKACVVSDEIIEVAAGTFNALKIEYLDNFRCCDGFSGYDKLTTWYSPEAKAIVKYKSSRYPFWNFQLTHYSINNPPG